MITADNCEYLQAAAWKTNELMEKQEKKVQDELESTGTIFTARPHNCTISR